MSGRTSLAGMTWIPGGTFAMGSDRHYPEEAPVARRAVKRFWIDERPVRTSSSCGSSRRPGTSRRRAGPDAADYPRRRHDMLFAGSVVFQKSSGPVDLRNHLQLVDVARRAPTGGIPEGPEARSTGASVTRSCTSRSRTRRRTPRGRARSCPTEAEWEFAARAVSRGRVRLGRRIHAGGQADGEHLAGRVSRTRTRSRTATRAPRRSASSRRTATGSTT